MLTKLHSLYDFFVSTNDVYVLMNVIVFSVKFQEERNKIILILKVRSRIEELEKKFLTLYMLNNDTRRQKWDTILNHQGRRYRNNRELQEFRASITIPFDIFIDTVVSVYGDFSDIAAHKVLFSVPYTRSAIEQMFRDIGIVPDVAKVRTIETLMTPINLP